MLFALMVSVVSAQTPAAEFDRLASKATRLEVMVEDDDGKQHVVFSSRKRSDFESMRVALRLSDVPEKEVCTCLPTPNVLLYRGSTYLGQLDVQWLNSAGVGGKMVLFADADAAAGWLETHGVRGAVEQLKSFREGRAEWEKELRAYEAARPAALTGVPDKVELQRAALQKAMPAEADQIRAVLRWMGGTLGPVDTDSRKMEIGWLLDSWPKERVQAAAEESKDPVVATGLRRWQTRH